MKFYKLIFSFFIVIFLIGCMISNSIAGNEKLSAPNNLVAWQSGECIQLRYDFDYEEQYEYNIYRSPNLGGEWEKLNFIPFPLNSFVDYNPLVYETSYYKVVRIDYYGNESFPSIIKVQYDLTKIGICIKGIFDKNNIISDQQLINFSSMSLWDIQNFLSDHGSYLATYYFNSRSAAQHIYDACQEHQINAQVVLTTLQKEQGLITSSTATQAQLNWAMGWDGSSDFGTQIYWGTKQFRRYYNNLESYDWNVGEPHTVNDGVVTPANIATAGLYIYTPWIGQGGGGAYGVGGNYLFWDLWYNTFNFGIPTSDNPPVVNFISISNPSITVGEYFTISYSVSDDVGLSWVELWRTNDKNGQPDENGWTQIGPQYSISGKNYSGEFYDSPSSPGIYWYGMHVGDTGVNWATETNPVKGTVTSANQPPTLSSGGVSPSSGTTSTTFIYSVNYYDPDGDSPAIRWVYIYTGGWSSHNMTLSSGSASNGTYTYSTNLSTGTHYYYFYFDDGTHAVWLPAAGSYYSGPTVFNSLSITTSSLPSGTQNQFYSASFSATGGTTPYTWSRSSGTFPSGLSLSLSGVFSGIPTNYGDFSFTIQVMDSGGRTDSKSFTLHIDQTIQYSLTTSVSPSGSGSVSPSGGTYNAGTSVTLMANHASNYKFDHWGGDASGTSTPVTITMNSNKNVIAYFTYVLPQYTLTTSVSPSGSGSVTLSPSGGTYAAGTVVTLTAHPNTNYKFDHWSGDASGTSNPVTITMNSNKNVIAYFTEELYAPQVTTNDASNITSISAKLNGNLDSTGHLICQVWFEYGKTTSYGISTTKQSKSSVGLFNETIISLDPNTTYHFKTCASNSEGTVYGADKTFITPMLGDFGSANNGPPDCKVDFEDLMIFALTYGSTPADPNWNPVCDIASLGGVLEPDGKIDFEDLMIFAMHYGETRADL